MTESDIEPVEMLESQFGLSSEQKLDDSVILDRAGNILDFFGSGANPNMLPRSEIIGRNIREFIHPEDADHVLEGLDQDEGERLATTLVYRSRRTEDERWHWKQAWIHRAPDGVPDHVILTGQDITLLHRLGQQLLMTEQIASCGIWRIDVDSPYPEVSPGMMRLLDLSPEERFAERKYWLLSRVHPADVKRVLKVLRQAMEGAGRFRFTCRVNMRDTSVKIVRTAGHVETDVKGTPVALVGVSTDITLISMAEQKLRENEQQYRLLTERASDIICQLSAYGTIEFISPAVRRLMGKSPNKLIGLNFNRLLIQRDRRKFDRFLDRIREGHEDELCTMRFKDAGGRTSWLEMSVRTLANSEGKIYGLIGAGRDISERKKLELDLTASRERAEEASESKSRLLATVSHELRTPLNAIQGYSELIRDQPFGKFTHDQYREYAELIHESGQLLQTFVNDLLDLSKIEAGKYELDLKRLNLKGVVQSAIRQIRPQAVEKGVTVEDHISRLDLELTADRRALSQILINLLSNAVKFTPKGGRVELAARTGGGRLWIDVRDTGIGIRKEDLERITAPFEQVSGELCDMYKGTGLGLALVKSLAELHGGELMIESEVGQGTRASVILPVERAAGP